MRLVCGPLTPPLQVCCEVPTPQMVAPPLGAGVQRGRRWAGQCFCSADPVYLALRPHRPPGSPQLLHLRKQLYQKPLWPLAHTAPTPGRTRTALG